MRQKVTSLHKNDRAILNAYAAQCLPDNMQAISQTVSIMAQQKQLSDILPGQRNTPAVNKKSIL